MDVLAHWPWWTIMLAMIGLSAFFSGSEAALFSLRWHDRNRLAVGSRREQLASKLLEDPDRLLTSILFCNLITNVTYFSMASVMALSLRKEPGGQAAVVLLPVIALVTMIAFGEVLPKSLGVIRPRYFAGLAAIPLSAAIHLVGPVLPVLQSITLLSRRVIWPDFEAEKALDANDLERAIGLMEPDAELAAQEIGLLRRTVELSQLSVQEWMRPRSHLVVLQPPVSLSDLADLPPRSDLLLIADSAGEVHSALPLSDAEFLPDTRIERLAKEVVNLPWCATMAQAFDAMHRQGNPATAIVNERGETIGALLLQDVLDVLFAGGQLDRIDEIWNRAAISDSGPGQWRVRGMVPLRRLGRHLALELPPSRNWTIGGVINELLERSPDVGDVVEWGPLRMEVVQVRQNGEVLLDIGRRQGPDEVAP